MCVQKIVAKDWISVLKYQKCPKGFFLLYYLIGKRNLMLRLPFLPNFQSIACWVADLNATLCFVTRTRNRTHNSPVYSGTLIPLLHPFSRFKHGFTRNPSVKISPKIFTRILDVLCWVADINEWQKQYQTYNILIISIFNSVMMLILFS